jgi:transformation/transcription domain-associated protein
MVKLSIIQHSWYEADVCLQNSTGDTTIQSKQFQPKETLVFIRLVKWAMQALDIYTLSVTPLAPGTMLPGGQRTQSSQTVRTKEEKEVLEHFAGVVSTALFSV